MGIIVESMTKHMQFAEIAADWIFNEFIKGIKHGITREMVLEKVRYCRDDALPMRFAAIMDGKCAGTIYLCENDLSCRSYTPWLAGLYVDPQYRKMGIGKALISHVREQAKKLGFGELYLRTEHASGYYKKLGWEFVERCKDEYRLEPDVFRIAL